VLNQAATVANDKESANNAKAILFEIQATTTPLSTNQVHASTVSNINTKVSGINKNLNIKINR